MMIMFVENAFFVVYKKKKKQKRPALSESF